MTGSGQDCIKAIGEREHGCRVPSLLVERVGVAPVRWRSSGITPAQVLHPVHFTLRRGRVSPCMVRLYGKTQGLAEQSKGRVTQHAVLAPYLQGCLHTLRSHCARSQQRLIQPPRHPR